MFVCVSRCTRRGSHCLLFPLFFFYFCKNVLFCSYKGNAFFACDIREAQAAAGAPQSNTSEDRHRLGGKHFVVYCFCLLPIVLKSFWFFAAFLLLSPFGFTVCCLFGYPPFSCVFAHPGLFCLSYSLFSFSWQFLSFFFLFNCYLGLARMPMQKICRVISYVYLYLASLCVCSCRPAVSLSTLQQLFLLKAQKVARAYFVVALLPKP